MPNTKDELKKVTLEWSKPERLHISCEVYLSETQLDELKSSFKYPFYPQFHLPEKFKLSEYLDSESAVGFYEDLKINGIPIFRELESEFSNHGRYKVFKIRPFL